MYIKRMLASSIGVLFFLLLFSKPYIARCQSPSTNEPKKQVVRIEVDTVLKGSNNSNDKKVVIIEDGQLPDELEGLELDTTRKDVQLVIIEKHHAEPTAKNRRRNNHNAPVVITKEVRIVKVVDDGKKE